MTRYMKRTGILVGFIFVLFSVMLCFTININTTKAASYALQSEELQKEYNVGQIVEVPSGSFGEYEADIIVTFPDGNAYKTNTVELTIPGIYQVEYRTVIDGVLHSEQKSFMAKQSAYGFSMADTNSTARFGTDENDEWSQWNSGKSGILLSLAEGDTFTFNRIFNIYETSADNLAFEFCLTPNTKYTSDAEDLYITFTDVYDPSNQLEYYVYLSNGSQEWTYLRARAPGQDWVGQEGTSSGMQWWVNEYGTPIYFTPGGALPASGSYEERPNTVAEQTVGLYYDVDNNTSYASYRSFRRDIGDIFYISRAPISDFDDLDRQENLWKGFTTGEVYVSVRFENYKSTSAKMIISNIAGQDLSGTDVLGEGADIHIDTKGYDAELLPNAVVGEKYPTLSAYALDKNLGGRVKVETRVFYDYSRSSGEYSGWDDVRFENEVNIIDGMFSTPSAGNYAICYRTTDIFGVKKEKVIVVEAKEGIELPALFDITVNESEKTVLQKAGNIVDIPGIVTYGGGVGPITLGAEYSINDVKKRAEKSAVNDGWWFIADQTGEYTVEIFAEDFYGRRASEIYTVTIAENVDAAIKEFVDIPDYFIENEMYRLPVLKSGEQTAEITIIDGLGTRTYNGQPMYFIGDENGEAIIRYSFGESTYDYKRPIIEVRNESVLELDKYFVSDDLRIRNTMSGISLYTYKKDGSARFIKSLTENNFAIRAYVNPERNAFNRLSYYLTDSADNRVALKVTFEKNGQATRLYINDEPLLLTLSSSNFYNASYFGIEYSASDCQINFLGGRKMPVYNTMYGDEFTGFPSGKVNVEIALENVTGEAEIFLTRINNQEFNTWLTVDNVAPVMSFNGTYSLLTYEIGDEFKLLSTVEDDVLSATTYTYVTVLDENQGTVTDINGRPLTKVSTERERTFICQKLGRYSITYVTVDGAGNTATYSFSITVLDTQAPEITISGNVPTATTVGEVVQLPSFSAVDSVTEDCVTYIVVQGPNNYYKCLTSRAFTVNIAGEYKITYFAMDEAGNTTQLEYRLSVSSTEVNA